MNLRDGVYTHRYFWMLNTTGVFVNVPGDCFSFFKGFCWRIKDRGRFDASGTRRRCFKHTFVKERLNKCLLVSCSPPVAHVCVLVHLPPAGHRKMHRLDSWKPEFVRRVYIYSSAPVRRLKQKQEALSRLFPPSACRVASFPGEHNVLLFVLKGGGEKLSPVSSMKFTDTS